MHQKFTSPQNKEVVWLQESYERRKERSLELGIRAIDALKEEGKSISYTTVADKTKQLDPTGIGIHQNTIRKNKELKQYFSEHRTSKTYDRRKTIQIDRNDILDEYKSIKEDRDLERVKQRYMQLTKLEIVELLIRTEQYIAQQNKIWLKNQFEKFQ